MIGIKVKKINAQAIKNELIKLGFLSYNFKSSKDSEHIFFPINNNNNNKEITKIMNKLSCELVDIEFEKVENKDNNLKRALSEILNEEELNELVTSYDVIGSIAILEIPNQLVHKEKIISEKLLKINPQIKTVLKKANKHDGTFRTQKMNFISGVNTLETIHRENNVRMFVNVSEVYFSPRLSNERIRISRLIKKEEEILVMFSGAAPYPLVLSKNSPAKEIIGIEINPEGHRLGLKNIQLNKIKNIKLFNGDVNEILPKIDMKFDRILMPLPKTGEEFLDIALSKIKNNGTIHYYAFLQEKDIPEMAIKSIKTACDKINAKFEIKGHYLCGQNAPRTYRICVDFLVKLK